MKYVKAYHVDAKDGRPASEYPLRHGPAWPSSALAASFVDRSQYPAVIIGTMPDEANLPNGAEQITQSDHDRLLNEHTQRRSAFNERMQEIAAEQARSQRNTLLNESDFAVLADSPVSDVEAWKTYRQALRDVPQQPGFPGDITWPVKP